MLINQIYIKNFFNFFLLLIFLNSFLLVDPELIIFFSISFVVILAVNNISELSLKFFNLFFIKYYYNYIKLFNFQLLFLYELNKFINLNLFLNQIPFFFEYFTKFINFINTFLTTNLVNWNYLFNFYFFKVVRILKIRLIKFYLNYYFLIIDQITYLFPKVRYNDNILLFQYLFHNIEKKLLMEKKLLLKSKKLKSKKNLFQFSNKNFKSTIDENFNKFCKQIITNVQNSRITTELQSFININNKPQQDDGSNRFFESVKEFITYFK